MNAISKEYDKIKKRMDKAKQDLKNLQERCPHENVTKQHRKDEGYSQRTLYYTYFNCKDCKKWWDVEGTQ